MSFTVGNESSKEFPAKLESLYPMLSFIEEGAGSVDKGVRLRMRLACEEAIVNIIKHAETLSEISVVLKREGECFHVELKDQGLPFDPLSFAKKMPEDFMEEWNGSGIRLMIRSADRVRYIREEKNNRLILEFDYCRI